MALTSRHYTRRVEVFPTFEGGELGRRSFESPRRAGQFVANNMLVNFRGHLVCRPGLKNMTPSGVGNGVVQGFGLTAVPSRDAWFVQGTTLHLFSTAGTNYITATGTFGTTPVYCLDWVELGTQIYMPNVGDGTYVLNPVATTATLTKLTGSPGGRAITAYNDRIVVGSVNTPDNKIRWNGLTAGVSDFNAWPAANFINVGDPWVLTALDWQRTHLLIAKQNQWHVLTGQFGADGDFSNLAVRKLSSSVGPLGPLECSLDDKDIAWYQGLPDVFPSNFDGTYPTKHRDINYSARTGNSDAIPLQVGVVPINNEGQGALFIDIDGKAALYMHGVWTTHTFGVPVTGLAASGQGPNGGSARPFICDGGGVSTPPKFYAFDLTLDTPGIEGDQFRRVGDDSSTALNGSVTFPEWWASDLAEVQVRSIIVDFSAYNNGAANTDHFDLTLQVLRRYESGDLSSSTLSFDSAPSNFSASGTRQRKIFGFNDAGLGNGFSMQFTNVRGIEIERIEVVLEDHPVRMGT